MRSNRLLETVKAGDKIEMTREQLIDRARLSVLHLSKWGGLFHLSKFLTRKSLRILCYHNFSTDQTLEWGPGLCIHPETFRRRLETIHRGHFTVLGLDEAVDRLYSKTLPHHAVVITIDDGFYNTKVHAHPLLKSFGYPYTIYVTTYYVEKETPIFGLLTQYLFWLTDKKRLDLSGLGLPFAEGEFPNEPQTIRELTRKVMNFGRRQLNHPDRFKLARSLARRLGVEFEKIADSRSLNLLTKSEIADLAEEGVDIQLHAHRHRWPEDAGQAERELNENRAALEPLVKNDLKHFCYPSGIYKEEQFPYLEKAALKSATTCEGGLNNADTPRYGLFRIMDGELIKQIEFEAWLSGYYEVMHKLQAALGTSSGPLKKSVGRLALASQRLLGMTR